MINTSPSAKDQEFIAKLYQEALANPHAQNLWADSMLKEAAEYFNVEQITIWRLSYNQQLMMCNHFYTLYKNNHGHDMLLQKKYVPEIFTNILSGKIQSYTAENTEEEWIEFTSHYLAPLGLNSCICVPLSVHGSIGGMLSIESIKKINWSPNQMCIAQLLSGIFSIILEKQEHEKLTDKMIKTEQLESLGRLSGGIAHDFNNVLTIMIGASESAIELINTTRPNKRVTDYLNEIHEAAMRGERLTQQLLNYFKKDSSQKKLIDINKVILDTKIILERIMEGNININLDLDYSIGKSMFIQSQLEQTLLNLAINSKYAMKDGGNLSIITRKINLNDCEILSSLENKSDYYLKLEVKDTGEGIDSDILPHITEEFYSTRMESGNGFGLSIIKSIVTENHGCMQIFSKPDKGTSISVYLPLQEIKNSELEMESANNDKSLQSENKILLVEDNENLRKLIKTYLQSKKYTVFESSSANDAKKLVAELYTKIDMVITDIMMPGMNGYEFGQHMIFLYPEIKIMYISGHTDVAINEIVILSKNATFLQKPFSLEQMEFRLEELLLV